MTRALLLTLLAGCHDEVLRVRLLYETGPDQLLVADAGEILGVDVAFTDDRRGAVEMLVVDICDARLDGVAMGRTFGTCYPQVRVADRQLRSVAHEIGHTLGLDHVDAEENLMSRHPSWSLDVTEEQTDTVFASVAWLNMWCP